MDYSITLQVPAYSYVLSYAIVWLLTVPILGPKQPRLWQLLCHSRCLTMIISFGNYAIRHKLSGLLQGASLSGPLCNIYYGHLVQQHLSEYLTKTSAESIRLLARGVDDFIFASTSKEEAQR